MWQKLVLGFVVVLFGNGAFAQSTLADLQAAKAVKLSQAEITRAVTGASVRGPTSSGGTMEIKYKADGTFAGTTQMSTFGSDRGVSSGSFGHWSVDKTGRLCAEGTTSKGGHPFKSCGFLYRLGDKFYVAGSTEQGAVYERTIKH